MLKKPKLLFYRRLSQTIFGLLLSNSYLQVITTKSIYSGALKGFCIPFLNCHACPFAIFSCPIGMLQYYAATQQLPFFLLGFFIVIGLVVGRAACGWLCPFGLIQDVMFKIKTRKFGIPNFLNYSKYVILILFVIILPFLTNIHWFSRLCPYGALIAGVPWILWNPIDPDFNAPVIDFEMIGFVYFLKIGILIFFLIWFVYAKRPFCRIACPLGAIWAVFNKVSLLRFTVSSNCTNCHQCDKVCPMELATFKEVDSENCIKCLDCTSCEHITAKFNIR